MGRPMKRSQHRHRDKRQARATRARSHFTAATRLAYQPPSPQLLELIQIAATVSPEMRAIVEGIPLVATEGPERADLLAAWLNRR